jgi:hypothetical protein
LQQNKNKNGNLKIYECICYKIISIVKYEKLKLFLKNGVVGGIFSQNFVW